MPTSVIRTADPGKDLAEEIFKAPGLDGSRTNANKFFGKNDEPAMQEKYRQQEIGRGQSQSGRSRTSDRGSR